MLLEVQGKSYKITVSDTTTGIHILGTKDSVVELSVHHQIPRHELLTYLQLNHKRLQKEAGKATVADMEWMEIQLFDKKYTLKVDTKTKTVFLKGSTVFAPRLPQTATQREQLKTTILRDYILEIIGHWEERLDFLLDDITIKTLRTNDYLLAKDRAAISYAKKLTDVNPDMLAYIVATSIFDYLKLNTEERDDLYDKYVKDWKYLRKIYMYEAMVEKCGTSV